jgi:hypothetical protein
MGTKFSNVFRCITSKWLLLLLVVLLLSGAAYAQVPPTNVFQLNGNPGDSNLSCVYGQPCDYWNLLNGTGVGNPPGSAGHSTARTFVSGTSNTFNFTGGGSKDSNLISQWSYTSTNTPNKDTLNGAYAAAYSSGSDFELVFGADRLSPSGDANIGIWFFQNKVGPNGSGGFSGSHVNHDVFIISAFTGGGGTSTVTALEWDSTCPSGVKNPTAGQCADTNLRLLAVPSAICGSSIYCGITNSAAVTSTWEGSLASPLFFEGGVDLTAAFAAVGITQLPCFSSFLVETRSSQSTTAVLKDFLTGGFPVCGMNISKACGTASINAAGTSINFPVNGIVTNTGVGTLFNVQVFDTVGNVTGSGINVVNNVSGSTYFNTNNLAAGDTATWSDSSISTSSSQSDSAYALAATSSGGAQTLQSGNTATATCTDSPVTMLTVSKTCKTTLQVLNNQVSVKVSYGGQVCNTGPSQVTNVALTDYPDSSNTSGTGTSVSSGITLGPGTVATPTCTSYSGTYTPTLIDQTVIGSGQIAGDGPGRYFFSDLIAISSATAAIGSLNSLTTTDPRTNKTFGFTTASCPICQGSSECTAP